MIKEYLSSSTTQTEELGYTLASELIAQQTNHAFIALFGEMGVGKTAFSRGFGKALGISNVKSPTYTIVNEYKGDPCNLFHFDFYRISDSDDLYSIGYEDYLKKPGFIISEWTERVQEEIPSDAIKVTISKVSDDDQRIIKVEK